MSPLQGLDGGVGLAGTTLSGAAGRWISGPFWPQAPSKSAHTATVAMPVLRAGTKAPPKIRFNPIIDAL